MFKSVNGGKLPTRATKYSACVDVYTNEDVVIGAGETKFVGLGIMIDDELIRKAVAMENIGLKERLKLYEYEFFKKSHYLQSTLHPLLSEKGLILSSGGVIINMDYRDEIKMIVHNPLTRDNQIVVHTLDGENIRYEPIIIKKGDRIGQITLLEHKSYLFGIDTEEERTGDFGSTGE